MMPSLLKLSFKLLSMMTNLPTHLVMLVNLNGGFGILNVCIHYTLPCFILFPEKEDYKLFFFTSWMYLVVKVFFLNDLHQYIEIQLGA